MNKKHMRNKTASSNLFYTTEPELSTTYNNPLETQGTHTFVSPSAVQFPFRCPAPGNKIY